MRDTLDTPQMTQNPDYSIMKKATSAAKGVTVLSAVISTKAVHILATEGSEEGGQP